MSQPGFPSNLSNPVAQQRGMAVEKPKSDVYTVMLIIALLAIGAAIGLLCSEMSKYDWDIKAQSVPRPKASLWLDTPRELQVARVPSEIPHSAYFHGERGA
jgi:hypothetical protein